MPINEVFKIAVMDIQCPTGNAVSIFPKFIGELGH